MNIAIILAGGTGNRIGYNIPKQFIKIADKTVIEHTITVFEKNTCIDEIAIVVHESYIAEIVIMTIKNDWKKIKNILKGGKDRFHSSLAAINAYQQFSDYNLLFHDAVRPLVSDRIINEVIDALMRYNAVTVAIPVTDTIYRVDNSKNFVETIPQRSFLQRAQTPQSFKVKTIGEAYQNALKDSNFSFTDDCDVVAQYLPNEKIYVVRGEENNIKLTYQEDIYLIEKLLF